VGRHVDVQRAPQLRDRRAGRSAAVGAAAQQWLAIDDRRVVDQDADGPQAHVLRRRLPRHRRGVSDVDALRVQRARRDATLKQPLAQLLQRVAPHVPKRKRRTLLCEVQRELAAQAASRTRDEDELPGERVSPAQPAAVAQVFHEERGEEHEDGA
jgi:hypothetical protein